MSLDATITAFTPDRYWDDESELHFGMAKKLKLDRQRYILIDAGWSIRLNYWSHDGRKQYALEEERAHYLEAISPTPPELRSRRRPVTGIDLYIRQRIGRPPTGIDHVLFGAWWHASFEIEVDYVQRFGCCGETAEAAEHGGVCQRRHQPARHLFIKRMSLRTFLEADESEDEQKRKREYFSLCDMCPRLLEEGLVRDMQTALVSEQRLEEARKLIRDAKGEFEIMMAYAEAIEAVGAIIEPYKDKIMALQGSELGFKTDKDKEGGYEWPIVKQCVVIATLKGFRIFHNEFNIIAYNFYGAKNGYKRIVRNWPGVTDLNVRLEVPTMASETAALVAVVASWKLNGEQAEYACKKTESADTRISVRVNAKMGPDAVLGKADRKIHARIHEIISLLPSSDKDMDKDDPKTINAVAVTQSQPVSGNLEAPAKTEEPPLKQHQRAWLEQAVPAWFEKAESTADIDAVVEDTRKRKPELISRVEAMAVEARKRFSGSAATKRESAGVS